MNRLKNYMLTGVGIVVLGVAGAITPARDAVMAAASGAGPSAAPVVVTNTSTNPVPVTGTLNAGNLPLDSNGNLRTADQNQKYDTGGNLKTADQNLKYDSNGNLNTAVSNLPLDSGNVKTAVQNLPEDSNGNLKVAAQGTTSVSGTVGIDSSANTVKIDASGNTVQVAGTTHTISSDATTGVSGGSTGSFGPFSVSAYQTVRMAFSFTDGGPYLVKVYTATASGPGVLFDQFTANEGDHVSTVYEVPGTSLFFTVENQGASDTKGLFGYAVFGR